MSFRSLKTLGSPTEVNENVLGHADWSVRWLHSFLAEGQGKPVSSVIRPTRLEAAFTFLIHWRMEAITKVQAGNVPGKLKAQGGSTFPTHARVGWAFNGQ